MAMARSLGMTGVLVLTGATRADNLFGAVVQPDYVIDSLSELLPEELPPEQAGSSSSHGDLPL
jgi:ribonucleotide monophosphatase NagD (HAD superfamily)